MPGQIMSISDQIDTLKNEREAAKLRKLIADLDRTIAVVKADIDTEEAEYRQRDVTNARYPLLALHLRTRCENLEATVRNLTHRLAQVGSSEVNS
jgi:hypothetical protein